MADTIDLGLVTAYGNAKEGGYTGTESQFNTLLANLPTYASNAAASATAAAASASDAEDAADRAEAIVGGQFVSYGQTQGLSDAQQEQARANISAGASNRNLLDNPFFTVNQRNITSLTVGTEKTYTLDRWYSFRAKITALSGGGITFAWNGTDLTSGLLAQGSAYDLRGKTVTLSAIINGKVFSWTAQFTGTAISYTFSGLNIRFQLDQAGSNTYAQIFIMTTTPVTISAIKLELGSYSTLANDVPQNDELECLKYQELIQNVAYNYIPIGFGAFAGGNTIRMFIPTSVPMNAASLHAFVPITGSASVAGNGTTISVASITLVGVLRTGVYVNVNLNSAPTTGHTYSLMLGDGASILIDCNL